MDMIINLQHEYMDGSNIVVNLTIFNGSEKDYEGFRFCIEDNLQGWIEIESNKNESTHTNRAVFQALEQFKKYKVMAQYNKQGEWFDVNSIYTSTATTYTMNVKEETLELPNLPTPHMELPKLNIVEEVVR